MNKIIAYFFFSTLSFALVAQSSEFKLHDNGLIYDESTIERLHYIVDSLNIRFKGCGLSREYNSQPQGQANAVIIQNKKKSHEALTDLKKGIDWDKFVKKYDPEIDEKILVVKHEYRNDRNDEIVRYQSIQMGENFNYYISFDKKDEENHFNAKWAFSMTWDKHLSAFYFPDGLSSSSLPYEYARLVQYSNCMIDTTTSVIYESASKEFMWEKEAGDKVNTFFAYVNNLNGKKRLDKIPDTREVYWDLYRTWDSLKFIEIEKHLPDEKFQKLLSEAASEALDKKYSFDELEDYVTRYLSKEIALELKRNRHVIGSCSMDFSPREHMQQIALLSAETAKWDVFLKSHLDVMNDNVNRASDGSWAWEHRNTYIKELEVLDIHVLDLLMGTCFRIAEPSKNHYFGSVSRVGRALSEYSKKEEFETLALDIIANEKLDSFNRLLAYYVLLNYRHNLSNEVDAKRADKRLVEARDALPKYIGKRL